MSNNNAAGITVYTNSTGYIVESQAMIFPLLIALLVVYRFTMVAWLPVLTYMLFALLYIRVRWQLVVFILALWQILYIMRGAKKTTVYMILMFLVAIPVFYLKGHGQGAVLYLTLGHCRGHYDLQPMLDWWPTVDRCAWDLPVFYTLLRRGLGWIRPAA